MEVFDMPTIRPEHNKMGMNPWEYQRVWEQAMREKEEGAKRQKDGLQADDVCEKPHTVATLFPLPLPKEWFEY